MREREREREGGGREAADDLVAAFVELHAKSRALPRVSLRAEPGYDRAEQSIEVRLGLERVDSHALLQCVVGVRGIEAA